MDKRLQFQKILDHAIDGKKIFGTSFCVSYKGESWSGVSGNFASDQQYFIASTTKLFVTAILLHLAEKGKITLDDHIGKYLDGETIKGLIVYNGRDYSASLKIRNLMAHTSGIPDYFQMKDQNGISFEHQILHEGDRGWSFNDIILKSKQLQPPFAPETPGKAHYSDTNFQLLGRIIENVSGSTFSGCCNELIISKAAMEHTYLYEDIRDSRPKPLNYKERELEIPRAMASFGPDGGMVSTSQDMLVFIQSFFNGLFFPVHYVDQLKTWNRIFFPMRSGIGIHLFKLPFIFNPFGTIPELIGHSGLSGALAYANPERDLYLAGTVNQIAYPAASFQLAIKLIRKLL